MKEKKEKIMAKLRADNKISGVLCLVFCLQRHIPSNTFDNPETAQHCWRDCAILPNSKSRRVTQKISLKCNVLALMTLQTIHFSAFIQPLAPLPHHTDAPKRAWQTLVAHSSKAGSEKVLAAPKLQTCTKNYTCL